MDHVIIFMALAAFHFIADYAQPYRMSVAKAWSDRVIFIHTAVHTTIFGSLFTVMTLATTISITTAVTVIGSNAVSHFIVDKIIYAIYKAIWRKGGDVTYLPSLTFVDVGLHLGTIAAIVVAFL